MTPWYEIVVVGSGKVARGFVTGFEAGAGSGRAVVDAREARVALSHHPDSILDALRSGAHTAFLAPAELGRSLLAALAEYGAGCELELHSLAEVVAASFDFAVEIFSESGAAEIRLALVGTPPEGVRVDGFRERVERDTSARSAELYTPAHAYAYRATGTVVGPLEGVLEVHRRARTLAFVRAEDVALQTRALPLPR